MKRIKVGFANLSLAGVAVVVPAEGLAGRVSPLLQNPWIELYNKMMWQQDASSRFAPCRGQRDAYH